MWKEMTDSELQEHWREQEEYYQWQQQAYDQDYFYEQYLLDCEAHDAMQLFRGLDEEHEEICKK